MRWPIRSTPATTWPMATMTDVVDSVTERVALDPDALAMLEDERDFLLRSLADLDREHAAGDVDETDYVSLRDDYTARAAAVLRSIEQRRTALAVATPSRSMGRRALWLFGIIAVAVLACVLIARVASPRQTGATATGDPLRDARQLLADAQQAAVDQKYAVSIDLYTKALAIQPGNVEALTYRGWSKMRSGDAASAAVDLDAAIDLDATYPDARVFRAVVFVAAKQYDAAAKQLAVFDTLAAPPLMTQIVDGQHLRGHIALGRVEPVLLVDRPPSIAASGFTTDVVFDAARQLDDDARPADELKLYAMMLGADAQDKRALTYEAWVLARAGVEQKQPARVADAVAIFDRVLAQDPNYADARVFRAFTYQFGLARSADAKADLAVFDSLSVKQTELTSLIDSNGLRAAIEASLAGK